MSKSKNPVRSNPKPSPSSTSKPARPVRPPAWRGRIGLIVAFFAITIGGAYLYLFQPRFTYSNVKTYRYKIAETYPHDTEAFTQGLVFHGGKVYESTGLLGQSTIRVIDLKSKQPTVQKVDDKLFAEGLTLWKDRLIQLTYTSEVALCYDLDLKLLDKTFAYEGQGWGLTHDGQQLIMSNGTSELQFRNPETFELDHRLMVTLGGRRIGRLNELEFVNGKIYANVWQEDNIVEIDPKSGNVTARIDLRGLLPAAERSNNSEAVLNGIAYNTDTNRFIVTGKYWPHMYEIELVSRDATK